MGSPAKRDPKTTASSDVEVSHELESERHKFFQLLRQVATIARIGIWELDLNNMRAVWSEEVYRIHEVPQSTIITLEFAISFYAPEAQEEIRIAVERGIKFGEPWDLKLPLVTATGKKLWVRALGTPEFKKGICTRLCGAFQDITEQRLAEDQRLEIERQLRQSQKMEAIGTLAGGIAHEFNNILGGIMGSLEFVEMRYKGGDNPFSEQIHTALEGCKRAGEIIRQMLSFSRDQRSEQVLCDLRRVVCDALPLLRAGIPASIELICNCKKQVIPILADRSQIHQVMLNVVTNAVQALPQAKGTISIDLNRFENCTASKFFTKELPPGRYASLTVIDDGVGISQDILCKIFDPFFTTKKPGEGTGLGLSVVHGIIRSHEGKILIDSSPGRGTKFHIILPEAEGEIQEFKESSPTILHHGNGESILVVDDEIDLGTVLGKLLNLQGYHCRVIHNPLSALELIKTNPSAFDAMLIDYTMPDLTGIELIKELRNFNVRCPILLMTGLQDQALGNAALGLGVSAILKKPTPTVDIMKVLSEVLNQ